MTLFLFIMAASTLLQLLAVLLAIRLIAITRRTFSWLLVSGAILLMVIRRCLTFYESAISGTPGPGDISRELFALAISALLASG